MVFGLKKKRTNNLILVFDDISPVNRLPKVNLIMSNISTHNTANFWSQLFFLEKYVKKLSGAGCQVSGVWCREQDAIFISLGSITGFRHLQNRSLIVLTLWLHFTPLISLGASFCDTWESRQHDIDDDMPHVRSLLKFNKVLITGC